ncbi:MAG TPA: hypothetical protein VMW12_13510 [Candidatus Dormibacteraeota bacterium]|nr:hypothetical protein [Candidatus Dormibacteraeota bacterium]
MESQPEEARPVISFTQVIESVSGSGSFAGWGPNVTGSSSIVRWN